MKSIAIETTPYDSVLIAEYLRAVAYSKKLNLNVTKVQKLLYILYGLFLKKYDRLIINETPKAWPYGPVFPNTREKVNYDKVPDINDPCFDTIKHDDTLLKEVAYVIENYAQYSAGQLSSWSHSKDGPWDKTTHLPNFKWNYPIGNNLIKSYFKSIDI